MPALPNYVEQNSNFCWVETGMWEIKRFNITSFFLYRKHGDYYFLCLYIHGTDSKTDTILHYMHVSFLLEKVGLI